MQPRRNNVKLLQQLCKQPMKIKINANNQQLAGYIINKNATLLSFAVSMALTNTIKPIRSDSAKLK